MRCDPQPGLDRADVRVLQRLDEKASGVPALTHIRTSAQPVVVDLQ